VRPAVPLLLATFVSGCDPAGARPPASAPDASVWAPAPTGVPTAKEAIALVFRNADVRLDSSPTCAGVGTSPDDVAVGDFLAGFLAEQSGQVGRNWIDAACAATAADAPHGWECHVVVRRVDGEERWGWGVRFLVRASDRTAVRSSFVCLGGG